jgi:hypothetical protein
MDRAFARSQGAAVVNDVGLAAADSSAVRSFIIGPAVRAASAGRYAVRSAFHLSIFTLANSGATSRVPLRASGRPR